MSINPIANGNTINKSSTVKPTTKTFKAESFDRILSQREKAYLDRSFNAKEVEKTTKQKPREFLGKYIDIKA